ncbi:MAG: acylphosphatase [Deltaproteobacteria bacterium]|nr:acylphosphatase [Deltaproteobacteria bacterium]
MTTNKNKRVHLIVSGRVQGVCFRHHTQQTAHTLGLLGFVKNIPDNRVEIVAEGLHDQLVQIINWAHQGPRSARVETVSVEWEDATNEFASFDVAY